MVGAAAWVLAALVSPALADAPRLGLPIACTVAETCWVQQYNDHDPSSAAQDYACGSQSYDGHDGIDIRIRDTAQTAGVVAAATGTVKAVRDGVDDHLMRSAADRQAVAKIECGNGAVIAHDGGWETQYCHMREGSVAVKAGEAVAAGQKLGEVGYSGMAAFPHVHLGLRKDGKAVDPFRSDASGCGGLSDPLWTDEAAAALAYRRGDILRTGIAPGRVDVAALEEGRMPNDPPSAQWDALVAYGWAINLEKDDEIAVSLQGPGDVKASNSVILDRPKAQYLLFAGVKRPEGGWPKGVYSGRFEVRDGGAVRLSKVWQFAID